MRAKHSSSKLLFFERLAISWMERRKTTTARHRMYEWSKFQSVWLCVCARGYIVAAPLQLCAPTIHSPSRDSFRWIRNVGRVPRHLVISKSAIAMTQFSPKPSGGGCESLFSLRRLLSPHAHLSLLSRRRPCEGLTKRNLTIYCVIEKRWSEFKSIFISLAYDTFV